MSGLQWFGGLFTLAVSTPFVLLGSFWALDSILSVWSGIRTRATVVACDGDYESRSVVVEFQDGQGINHQVRLSTVRGASVGGEVEILYDPVNPESVRSYSFDDLWSFPMTFGGLGLMGLLLAVLILCGLIPVE